MPFPTVDNDMLNIGVSNGQIPVIGAGNKLPDSIINGGVGANQFIKLDGSARLPAVDASLLTNLPAPSGGVGSLNLLDTQIVSAPVGQVDFTSGIDATFAAYLIKVINATPSASSSLRLAISTDGGISYRSDANYQWSNAELRAGVSPTWNLQGNTTSGSLDLSQRTLANGEYVCNDIILYQPSFAANKKLLTWQGATIDSGYNRVMGGGHYNGSNNAINALRFFFSGGNIASGTFKLYGIN